MYPRRMLKKLYRKLRSILLSVLTMDIKHWLLGYPDPHHKCSRGSKLYRLIVSFLIFTVGLTIWDVVSDIMFIIQLPGQTKCDIPTKWMFPVIMVPFLPILFSIINRCVLWLRQGVSAPDMNWRTARRRLMHSEERQLITDYGRMIASESIPRPGNVPWGNRAVWNTLEEIDRNEIKATDELVSEPGVNLQNTRETMIAALLWRKHFFRRFAKLILLNFLYRICMLLREMPIPPVLLDIYPITFIRRSILFATAWRKDFVSPSDSYSYEKDIEFQDLQIQKAQLTEIKYESSPQLIILLILIGAGFIEIKGTVLLTILLSFFSVAKFFPSLALIPGKCAFNNKIFLQKDSLSHKKMEIDVTESEQRKRFDPNLVKFTSIRFSSDEIDQLLKPQFFRLSGLVMNFVYVVCRYHIIISLTVYNWRASLIVTFLQLLIIMLFLVYSYARIPVTQPATTNQQDSDLSSDQKDKQQKRAFNSFKICLRHTFAFVNQLLTSVGYFLLVPVTTTMTALGVLLVVITQFVAVTMYVFVSFIEWKEPIYCQESVFHQLTPQQWPILFHLLVIINVLLCSALLLPHYPSTWPNFRFGLHHREKCNKCQNFLREYCAYRPCWLCEWIFCDKGGSSSPHTRGTFEQPVPFLKMPLNTSKSDWVVRMLAQHDPDGTNDFLLCQRHAYALCTYRVLVLTPEPAVALSSAAFFTSLFEFLDQRRALHHRDWFLRNTPDLHWSNDDEELFCRLLSCRSREEQDIHEALSKPRNRSENLDSYASSGKPHQNLILDRLAEYIGKLGLQNPDSRNLKYLYNLLGGTESNLQSEATKPYKKAEILPVKIAAAEMRFHDAKNAVELTLTNGRTDVIKHNLFINDLNKSLHEFVKLVYCSMEPKMQPGSITSLYGNVFPGNLPHQIFYKSAFFDLGVKDIEGQDCYWRDVKELWENHTSCGQNCCLEPELAIKLVLGLAVDPTPRGSRDRLDTERNSVTDSREYEGLNNGSILSEDQHSNEQPDRMCPLNGRVRKVIDPSGKRAPLNPSESVH